MPNAAVLRFVKEFPKPVEYDFGDGVILRYYEVSEMDPVIDELVQDLNSVADFARKARKILREHKLNHLLDL